MITDFVYLENLLLKRRINGASKLFEVARAYPVEFRMDGNQWRVTVPAGTMTDLASIPKIVPKWIAEKLDAHLEAAIVHDWLCVWRPPWSTSEMAADIFLAAMIAANVGRWKRTYMYKAVKYFGPSWS